jgi:DNA (cytosine-5)-methyltransferase 1
MRANPRFERDERHFLYREYLKIIADHKPPVFVMENVKGLLSATVEGESTISRIVADLSRPEAALKGNDGDLEYRLYSLSEDDAAAGDIDPRLFLVRSEEYGVPQARHRMFIVGIRGDLSVRPRRLRRRKPPTVLQTIGDLPAIRSGLSRGADNPYAWEAAISEICSLDLRAELNGSPVAKTVLSRISRNIGHTGRPDDRCSRKHPGRPASRMGAVAGLYDPRLHVLTGHESRSHMPGDLRRYMYAAVFAQVTGMSPKLSDFPSSLLPAHDNVDLGRAGRMFSDRFRVQLPDQVSTTITSHISKDGHYYIHYDPAQCRSLTVREAARLQTFPDNYQFEGPRTSQYHQVGNAVPPFLARQIAEIIADVLDAVGEGV